jgi:hypothetical protein
MLKYFEMILIVAFVCYLFYDESNKKTQLPITVEKIHSFIILDNGDTAWVKLNERSIIDITYTLKKPE